MSVGTETECHETSHNDARHQFLHRYFSFRGPGRSRTGNIPAPSLDLDSGSSSFELRARTTSEAFRPSVPRRRGTRGAVSARLAALTRRLASAASGLTRPRGRVVGLGPRRPLPASLRAAGASARRRSDAPGELLCRARGPGLATCLSDPRAVASRAGRLLVGVRRPRRRPPPPPSSDGRTGSAFFPSRSVPPARGSSRRARSNSV